MRGWLLLPVVLVLAGCSGGDSSAAPGPSASPTPPLRCEPAPDPLAFQITAHLKPSGPKLQRPFIVREPGWILLAANTLNADGTVRKRGAVWVAKDPAGASLSSLNDIARAESDLPDGRPLFPGAVDSPGVTAVQACVVSG